MPRKPRKKGENGIYHVIWRGINKQTVFEDEQDINRFKQTILEYKSKTGFKLYAYCFMGNHIHLLIQEGIEDISITLRRIGASYVYWYNLKYKRCGHLFQDRYISESVDNDRYFMAVVRYIHHNPLKAGIVNNISDYKWSSYNEYIMGGGLTDIDYALDLINVSRPDAVKCFKSIHHEVCDVECRDVKNTIRMSDNEVNGIIKQMCNIQSSKEIQIFDKQKRNIYLKRLKEKGISTRQLSRLTGINRHSISKI